MSLMVEHQSVGDYKVPFSLSTTTGTLDIYSILSTNLSS